MNMSAALEAMRRDLEDAATHLGRPHDLRFKSMFSGLMAYLDEKPCAWLTAGGVALKLAPADQRVLLQLDGASRLIARTGAAQSRHYILLPTALRRDTGQLAGWLARSAARATIRPRSRR
ncbi:MAG: hypothetical protein EPN49_03190 [Rhodanobacter sp.]|nr:MAG: hypothetical protein EPN49_03190 [Rhodanobacter sp.]